MYIMAQGSGKKDSRKTLKAKPSFQLDKHSGRKLDVLYGEFIMRMMKSGRQNLITQQGREKVPRQGRGWKLETNDAQCTRKSQCGGTRRAALKQ